MQSRYDGYDFSADKIILIDGYQSNWGSYKSNWWSNLSNMWSNKSNQRANQFNWWLYQSNWWSYQSNCWSNLSRRQSHLIFVVAETTSLCTTRLFQTDDGKPVETREGREQGWQEP